eukprot:1189868-Prorocentrum_minimum.AAC.2
MTVSDIAAAAAATLGAALGIEVDLLGTHTGTLTEPSETADLSIFLIPSKAAGDPGELSPAAVDMA